MHVKLVKQAARLVLSVASGDAVCCREASQNQQLQSPQQYGIWQVEGLGLVVAFRGTSSWDDVFVDVNVRPIPLSCEGGMAQLYAHHLPVDVVPDIEKPLPDKWHLTVLLLVSSATHRHHVPLFSAYCC